MMSRLRGDSQKTVAHPSPDDWDGSRTTQTFSRSYILEQQLKDNETIRPLAHLARQSKAHGDESGESLENVLTLCVGHSRSHATTDANTVLVIIAGGLFGAVAIPVGFNRTKWHSSISFLAIAKNKINVREAKAATRRTQLTSKSQCPFLLYGS